MSTIFIAPLYRARIISRVDSNALARARDSEKLIANILRAERMTVDIFAGFACIRSVMRLSVDA